MNSMAKTILVALKPKNKIDMLLRHLEKVVKRGDRIVFLVAYQHDTPSWLLAQIALLQTGFDNGVACEERRARLSWDEQKTRAQEDVAEHARRVFGRIGVEVNVDLYCGSLNRIMERYLDTGEVALIVVGGSSWLRRLKIVPTRVRDWFVWRPHHPSVLLMQPED
jgi:nucleotide-binding universal stress UspA family protein